MKFKTTIFPCLEILLHYLICPAFYVLHRVEQLVVHSSTKLQTMKVR